MPAWFRRLADVPKIGYPGSPGVDRTRLPGHDAVAQGRSEDYLSWPIPNGSTSESPSHAWKTTGRPGEAPADTALRQLYEKLELPGTVTDYYWALNEAIKDLYDQRRSRPDAVEKVEYFCLLTLTLVEAYPKTVTSMGSDGDYYMIEAIQRLVDLYKAEGYVHEAAEIAHRAARFKQPYLMREEIKERLDNLKAEHDP